MRHDKIDLLLCERIKRHAFLKDPSQIQMEALNVRLLARAVWIAVENPYASWQELARIVFRIGAVVFYHFRIAELRSIVRYDAAEELTE